ncbi:MAG: ATP-binding cassette domain-containing protein, partial [Mollicutes bacterium PWAP]|nr:ATP-binding cassette domain-containing protein [Mollicutes bacterium PWAP]
KNKKYYELNSQIQKSNNDSTHVVDLSYDFETIFDDIYKEQQKTIKFQKQNLAYFALKNIKGKQLRKYRTNVGMIFQRYNLIYKSSVLTNVISGRLSQMNPFRAFFGIYSKKDVNIALKALADVNILETAYVRADELSGGQQQRVALARTIAQNGSIILADEPVGALDPIMAKEVMDSFLKVNKESKKTVLLNLHHVDLALTYADRIIGVKKGKIVFDGSSWKVDMNVLKKIYGEELEGFDNHELKEIKRKREKLYKEFPQYKDLSKNKKLFTKGSKNNV